MADLYSSFTNSCSFTVAVRVVEQSLESPLLDALLGMCVAFVNPGQDLTFVGKLVIRYMFFADW